MRARSHCVRLSIAHPYDRAFMSGIVGTYRLDGEPVDIASLRAAHAQLDHRGPDGRGCWHDGAVGLGHQALYTTPEAHLTGQPLREGPLVLTADARIDNRSELIRALGIRQPAEKLSDAELILAAYQKWNQRCVEHLVGAFAFALWDGRSHRLFCARDHIGIKPFYYFHAPNRLFVFGTEIKAILAHERVPKRINEARVADYLAGVMDDKEITSFEDILRLPPAHCLTVGREGKVQRRRYWTLDPERRINGKSDEEYAAGFLDLFTEAVRCRLRAPTPVGLRLSGGVDSSSVAAVASQLLRDAERGPLHALSATFPDLPPEDLKIADEREYIAAVAGLPGIKSHLVSLASVSPLIDMDTLLWHVDQPIYIRNTYLEWTLLQAARDQGIRVVLDGLEGDTTVSHGFGFFGELAHDGQWKTLARIAEELEGRSGLSRNIALKRAHWFLAWHANRGAWRTFWRGTRTLRAHFDERWWHLIWNYGIKPQLPAIMKSVWNALRGRSPRGDAKPPLLSTSLYQRTRFAERREAFNRWPHDTFSQRHAHARALTHGSVPLFLEEGDHIASARGIESRHPFFDVRLIEYCVALPPEQKLQNGWTRYIIRRAMKGMLPEVIRLRTDKASLSPNHTRNLFKLEQGRIQQDVLGQLDQLTRFVDSASVRGAVHNKAGNDVWPLLQLAIWLSNHGSSLEPASGTRNGPTCRLHGEQVAP